MEGASSGADSAKRSDAARPAKRHKSNDFEPRYSEGERPTPESLRIVLLGKTGSGKSSSGNTILGRKVFEAVGLPRSVTRRCQKENGEVNGRQVTVVDTPGLFDTSLSHKEINEEILQCVSLLAPGPHVFLLVLRIDRFTPEQRETIKLIREGFGRGADKFTIILLTGGDTLEREKISIDDFIRGRCDASFKDLISDCGGRYHLFNNYDKQNKKQVSVLINKIDEMVKRNSCFTNEMLKEAEDAIQTNMKRLLKEKQEEMEIKKMDLEKKHSDAMKQMKEKYERQIADIEEKRRLGEKHQQQMEKKLADLEHQIQTNQNESKQEEEDERKAIEKSKKEIENLKKTYEEEARQRAEEFNEFMEKYKKGLEAMELEYKKLIEAKEKQFDILKELSAQNEEQLKKKYLDQIRSFVNHMTKKSEDLKEIDDVQKKQVEEINELKDEKRRLQEKHEKEMDDLVKTLLNQGTTHFSHGSESV